jgi:hypothetical protein
MDSRLGRGVTVSTSVNGPPRAAPVVPPLGGARLGSGWAAASPKPDRDKKRRKRDRDGRWAEAGAADLTGKAAKRQADRADRAADNLFRIAHGKHESLSGMADSKAHIMITICAAVIGVSATQVYDPLFQYAALVLIVSSLAAAVFAVWAITPSLPHQRQADPRDPQFNVVFFSDFARLPYETFQAEVEALIHDRTALNRALIRDLYSLGRLLARRKYRYLRYCYRTFLAGMVLGGAVFLVSLALIGWR